MARRGTMKDKTRKCKKCHQGYDFLLTKSDLCPDCVKKYPYFLSFVEEGFVGVAGKTFGRIEVYSNRDPVDHAIDELRFLFKESLIKDKAFREFREKWDFQNVSEKELKKIKKTIKSKFLNHSRSAPS